MLWFEEDVQRLEKEIALLQNKQGLIFYGSSSIRLWETLETDFAGYEALNIGFGGSTLAACVWYFERIFTDLQPTSLIVYAGDNDLGDGREPEEVFLFFKEMVHLVRNRFGDIPLGYISIKPSISRWNIVDKIRCTNKLIESEIKNTGNNICFLNIYNRMTDKAGYPKPEYLEPDGLHITEKGYLLWKEIILQYVADGALKLTKKTVVL